ncbi:hypothetical protein SAMN05444062_101424 [Pseudomonas syringae]|jgi:hypothetical protein|uniref:Uncharacterized protein n=1 Tax=Pseudomonas syringae TaxID=317 RepID=A0AB38BMX2_PSESX|nr:hypothetical protein CCL23_13760 [Pseudomonas syringae]SFG78914.1 hypothetical protein SAMN05444062_101424 [Pseudomonas syringae]SFN57733.1 hypothetical protein SAMN05444065_101280 [Pseudomonas syringae]SFO40895.1 hypothetical protein SAMN05444063_105280 [Pseudomonas syringae]
MITIYRTPRDIALKLFREAGRTWKVRGHVVSLACEVIDSVCSMGLQFPGSTGPGEVILKP